MLEPCLRCTVEHLFRQTNDHSTPSPTVCLILHTCYHLIQIPQTQHTAFIFATSYFGDIQTLLEITYTAEQMLVSHTRRIKCCSQFSTSAAT